MNREFMLIFNTRERMIDYINMLKEKYNFGNFSHSKLYIQGYEIFFAYQGSIRCQCRENAIRYHVGKHEDLSTLINIFKYMEMHYDIFKIIEINFSISKSFSFVKFDKDAKYEIYLNLSQAELYNFLFNELWNNDSIVTAIIKENFNSVTMEDYRRRLVGKQIDFMSCGLTVISLTPYFTLTCYNKDHLRNDIGIDFRIIELSSHEGNVNLKKLLEDFLLLW